jgi:allantoinase
MAGIHNESDEMERAFIAEVEASGITDYRAHGLSRPPRSPKRSPTRRFSKLAPVPAVLYTSCTARLRVDMKLAAAYRSQGHEATIEACIHYLTLDEENDVRRLGGKAKINPPLRSRRRSRGHMATSRQRQCHRRIDRSRELVGGAQDRSEHAQERVRSSRA